MGEHKTVATGISSLNTAFRLCFFLASRPELVDDFKGGSVKLNWCMGAELVGIDIHTVLRCV